MIRVKLTIIYKKIKRMNETSYEENIAEFMKRIINQNKVTIQKNVSLMFLDSNYRLLSLSSKVPNKLLVIAIDIKELYERNLLLNNMININEIEPFIYKVQNILSYRKETKKEKQKEKEEKVKQITKEEFNQVIKPVVVKIEKDNKITKPIVITEAKEQKKKPIKKNIKKVSKTKYISTKKQDIKKIKIKNKELKNIKKNLNIENKIEIKKQKEIKPIKIQMTVKLMNDKPPVVIVLKDDKKNDTAKKEERNIVVKNKQNLQTKSNKKVENKTIKVNKKDNKDNNDKTSTKKENKENKSKLENIKIITNINIKNKSKEKNKVKEIKQETGEEKQKKEQVLEKPEKINKIKNQEEKLKKKEKIIEEIEELDEEKEEKEEEQNISYTIISPDNEVLYHVEIINETPITVEDMLIQSGLEINNSNGFIESINGIKNQGMAGWVFEVNNIPIMVSAAEYVINPSDQITWKYVDFSEMMEKDNLKGQEESKTLIKQNSKGKKYEKKVA